MYLPSSSWGKLGAKEVENILKQYMDMDDVHYDALTDTPYAEMAITLANVFGQPSVNSMTQLELMKHLLEGIKMPVTNPKTGEQDYVDITLVNKIVVDSEYVEDMKTNDKIKVDVTLSGNKETNHVTVTVSNTSMGIQGSKIIELQAFEEMLFKAINEVKDQRLEEVQEFKEITDSLLNRIVEDSRENSKKYYARMDRAYMLNQGVGVIRDIKTNQEVGTFETLDYTYQRSERVLTIGGVMLSGRTYEDLQEKDRFEFAFYSLETGSVYSIIAANRSAIKVSERDSSVDIRKFDLIIDEFTKDHSSYHMATVAQEKKSLLDGMDESHPLYASNMQQFRESRLAILEESKNRQKQEKLVNQFADIDLDF